MQKHQLYYVNARIYIDKDELVLKNSDTICFFRVQTKIQHKQAGR